MKEKFYLEFWNNNFGIIENFGASDDIIIVSEWDTLKIFWIKMISPKNVGFIKEYIYEISKGADINADLC